MTLHEILPRVAIRTKLAAAFAVLTVVPLALVAAVATRTTVTHLRATATVTLKHDLEAAAMAAERALARADADVHHLSLTLLGPLPGRDDAVRWHSIGQSVSEFLKLTPSLFQIKLIDESGTLLLVARPSGNNVLVPDEGDAHGIYYAVHAWAAKPGEHLILPVELRAEPEGSDEGARIPAVAFLVPVRDGASGVFRRVVVGEAHAPTIFAGLEAGSPHLAGVTGLLDSDGLYLYDSERKRGWAGMVADRSELDLRKDFSPAEIKTMLSGEPGTLMAMGNRIVSFFPLRLGASAIPPLTLYRAVPLAVVDAPVRRFLGWVVVAGLAAVLLVIALALGAANHFTRPIYSLRQAVARLGRGESPTPVRVATNDELQDLAADFSAMAASLFEYRRNLEDLVKERTHALQETHAELADILAYSADAIIGLDPEGRVRLWNRGAESLFGYTAAEALGRNADALLLPGGRGARREAAFIRRELSRSGAMVNLRTRRVAKNGEVIPVSLTQTRIGARGGNGDGTLGSSLIIRDSRMQARLEEHMRRSERLAVVS
ncbi:MAG: PAS domain S-box protein, partial [Gemmatimonadetes bacterium]|nr:PAS domain S-box protein [Gemmatimonadota bacterium]